MHGRSRTLAFLLVLGVLLLLLVCGPISAAFAHTELVHWEFVGGTADKPQELLLRFSEPIDARFLTVSVFDQGGQQSPGKISIDSQRRTDGRVDISALPPGTYSVAWWTRALDGDPSNGSFFIGIGATVDPTALLPPIGARDPATQPAMFYEETTWDAILHWLTYLGAALAIGSLGFALLIWRPLARKATAREGNATEAGSFSGEEKLDLRLLRVFRFLAIAGSMLFIFANLLLFLMQVEFIRYSLLQPVTAVNPTPLAPSALSHEAPYSTVADIFHGYNGRVWIARMVLAVVTLTLSFRLSASVVRRPWRWVAALVGALAALMTVSLTAHAAVVPQSRFSVVIDWSHMTAMSLWLGGLVPLLLTLREERRLRSIGVSGERTAAGEGPEQSLVRPVVRRFSSMALIAVIYLAATGLFAAYLHVRNPSILAPTTYGRTLIAKLVLFAALFALGAVHRRVSIPRLQRSRGIRRSALERLLPVEIAVGCALLAAVALMASLGTSAAVWPAHQALGIVSHRSSTGLTATFRAVPGKAGENAIALDVADRRPGQATIIQQVTVEVGGNTLLLTPAGPLVPGSIQRFVSKDLVELQEGPANVTFAVSRPAYPEISGEIPITLAPALASAPSEK